MCDITKCDASSPASPSVQEAELPERLNNFPGHKHLPNPIPLTTSGRATRLTSLRQEAVIV